MAESDLKAVSDSFEGLEGMNLPVAAFVEAFKTNPVLVRKIALVTGFEEHLLKLIPQEELLSTFAQWDTEGSGNLSFENFVQGLSKMRQFNRSATEQAEVAEEQAVLDASVQEAKAAFLAAGGGQGSELDLQAFLVALSDATLVVKIATATGLPTSFFESLSVRQLLDLFKEVDLDCSGTVSLEEWIEALVRIRMTIYDERKAEMDAAMDAVRTHAEAALNEGDEDWSGEFDFREFIVAFKYNPTFLRKVSLATGISAEELGSMQDESIEDLFLALDTDFSGTVSFAEFVKGLAQIRLIRKARVDQERQQQEAAMLDEALSIAAEAFESADFDLRGELDLQSFMQALGNTKVAEKVSQATSVPTEWFLSLDVGQMVQLFQDIDADANGKVSFQEWILALLRVRQANQEDLKAERQQEMAAIESLVEEALEEGDEDWSGELDFREFIAAFRCNPRFVRKVALAADTTVEDLSGLENEDLEQFFAVLDTDRSGTISFDEFVNGLLDIRLKRHAYAREQAEAENQAVIDVAYLDALDAFSQAGSAN
ncbi:Txnl4a [Symbiodinium necroappetens]|uniref:Txnl4a protein n=1 Tax=Symbiodinium necroappetens TaxID=1628268 RepID=A0A812YCM5_9DINO|nr:Txnl4a [Symbiodinium necroappetens]